MKMRIPTIKEYNKLVKVTGGDDDKMHWKYMFSHVIDAENQFNIPATHRAGCGYYSARYMGHYSASYQNVPLGFRPAIDLAPADLPSDIKAGDTVVMGTLYMNGDPVRMPLIPTSRGDVEDYIPGTPMELREPLEDSKYQITGIYVGDGVVVADRVILKMISCLDLQELDQKAEEAEYYKKEDIVAAMRSVTEDSTCPIHLAAEINQILGLTPTVKISCTNRKEVV